MRGSVPEPESRFAARDWLRSVELGGPAGRSFATVATGQQWPSSLWSPVAANALKLVVIFFFLDTGKGVAHLGDPIKELES
jgi:hypothetical protein